MDKGTRMGKAGHEGIARGLSRVLADTHMLLLATRSFRWNVTGPQFFELRALFETQASELVAAGQLLAERIRVLGFEVPGMCRDFVALSSIEAEYEVREAGEMIRVLCEGHQSAVRTMRGAFQTAQVASDSVTCHLLSQRMGAHESAAWRLGSQLVSEREVLSESQKFPIDDAEWDTVDEAGWESFPASDPPAFAVASTTSYKVPVTSHGINDGAFHEERDSTLAIPTGTAERRLRR